MFLTVTNWKLHLFSLFESIILTQIIWEKAFLGDRCPDSSKKVQRCWGSVFGPTLQDRADSWMWHSLPETSSNGARKSFPTEQKMVLRSYLGVHLPREGQLLKFPFIFWDHSFSDKGSQFFLLFVCLFVFTIISKSCLFSPTLLRWHWHKPVSESVILPWYWHQVQFGAQSCCPPQQYMDT